MVEELSLVPDLSKYPTQQNEAPLEVPTVFQLGRKKNYGSRSFIAVFTTAS